MRTAFASCLALPTLVFGQGYRVEIVVDPPVIEQGQTATIELHANFNSSLDWAMTAVLTSFLCDAGSRQLSDVRLLAPMDGPGTTAGSGTIAGIEGILAGQLHDPLEAPAPPTDPMPFWGATYTAPATSEPRVIGLRSSTARFAVYIDRDSIWSESRMLELVEGSATITIVACRADVNEDGVLDIFDFLAFFNAFDAGEPIADFDFDGELTVFDFLAFQNRFDAGC